MYPEHPLALEIAISLGQLQREPLILTEETCTYRRYLLHQLKQSNITPNVDMEFRNLEGIKDCWISSAFGAFIEQVKQQ